MRDDGTGSLFDSCGEAVAEDARYLTEQVITYIGNKRALLDFIGEGIEAVRGRLGGAKLRCMDVFAGSGVVSRLLKGHASVLYSNDLEDYVRVLNSCYLANKGEVDTRELQRGLDWLREELGRGLEEGFIAEMYAPKDDEAIRPGERVFYTRRNAMFLDTARQFIEKLPPEMRVFYLGPLLYEASVHANTSGVFKGFYKNKQGVGQFGGSGKDALMRIRGDMELRLPVFSRFDVEYHVMQKDARAAVKEVPELDLAYLDPPYNQHPYGSNYFMLNLVTNYRRPEEVSEVSGIPMAWNRSPYNKRPKVQGELFALVAECPARYVLISYNSEGFVTYDEMVEHLSGMGKVEVLMKGYNTFRGCRNLRNRNLRVKEFLFLLEKT